MATDAIKAIGTITINGFDLCLTKWTAKESGNKIDTTSTCDGTGQSALTTNKMLTITFDAIWSDSRPHHNTSNHNLNVDATVDVVAFVGSSSTRKYTMTSAKVMDWSADSSIKDVMKISGTIESQGTGYTVPTA